jgi:thioredoxin-like negative regulator of GroEL
MIIQLKNLDELRFSVNENKALLVYFSNTHCNVCKVLKPKIQDLLTEEFPLMKMYYCDTIESPEIAAQNSIFTVPTIVIYFDGKEYIRKSRNIGIMELQNDIERPYSLLFTNF